MVQWLEHLPFFQIWFDNPHWAAHNPLQPHSPGGSGTLFWATVGTYTSLSLSPSRFSLTQAGTDWLAV